VRRGGYGLLFLLVPTDSLSNPVESDAGGVGGGELESERGERGEPQRGESGKNAMKMSALLGGKGVRSP
jgi:hypothetical protein